MTRSLENILTAGVQKKAFTLEALNLEINTFPYHRVDVNHPQRVQKASSGVNISATCSETWTLLRLLPLLLSKVIKEGQAKTDFHEEFTVLVLLIDLVQHIMADEFSQSSVSKLVTAVKQWLTLFHRVFPDFQMTPKFHNLVHYPSQVRKHGPLKKYSAIRYEAKHSEMKQYLANSKNRMNPCKSMAEAHQLASALRLSSSKQSEVQTEKHLGEYELVGYKVGDCISVKCANDNVKLIEITELSSDSSKAHEAVAVVRGVTFANVELDNNLMAFRVSKEEPAIARLEDLFHFHPMGLYNINDVKYVVPQFNGQLEPIT